MEGVESKQILYVFCQLVVIAVEKNEAGKGKKECQGGGVAILNYIFRKGLCEKVKLNQDLKEVREDLGMI